MSRLESYVNKHGLEAGSKLYHALQSRAARAGVSARLRRKIDLLTGRSPVVAAAKPSPSMPLFPEIHADAMAEAESTSTHDA